MTKQELIELLEKVDEGEQIVPIESGLEGADLALTLEPVTYRGVECYDIGLDCRDEGEPVAVDIRILVGRDLLNDIVDNVKEEAIQEFLEKTRKAFLEGVNETDEVSAE